MQIAPEQACPGGALLIALGANLPAGGRAPEETLRWAAAEAGRRLSADGTAWRLSPLYRTPAYPPGAGPDYVNAVMELTTERTPAESLAELHRIEALADRQRESRWAARTLDLDLLDAGGAVVPDAATVRRWVDLDATEQARRSPEELILPHPRLQDRGFVLVPLVELAPDWRHPVLDRTARALLDGGPLRPSRP